MNLQASSRGLALVIVLFILAIMTASVTWLSEEVVLAIRGTENSRDSEQAWQVLVGSEAWGVSVLAKDGLESVTDHPGEGWNSLGQGVVIERGSLSTTVEDLQGRFNINNLSVGTTGPLDKAQAAWPQAFQRLLISLEIDPALTNAVLDWLDTDQSVRGTSGAEDIDYLGQVPPYRAANREFSEISELIWVKGFNEEIIQKLAPYIIALPGKGIPININTAPPGLLRMLGKNLLSEQDAEMLVRDRPQEGYTVESFLLHDKMAGEQDVAAPLIDDNSSYFLIHSATKVGRSRMKLDSLVERKGGRTMVIKRIPVL